MHVVAVGRQPLRVHPGGTSDVENPQRRLGQMTAQDLAGPQQLEASQPLRDASVLVDLPVVLEDLGGDRT